ncbi:MAG: hypothetical protein E6Q54_03475 [Mycolicibacter arupensis]|uniref:Uncharacterized protein n=1 Tax=Mycolicibacter arupensis TaxID=342002 RepID=A0A5C7YD57_9MYCO|nr:MAG: hypothetical protein E6Q54_03475 [Mycolicibacter arupensis]
MAPLVVDGECWTYCGRTAGTPHARRAGTAKTSPRRSTSRRCRGSTWRERPAPPTAAASAASPIASYLAAEAAEAGRHRPSQPVEGIWSSCSDRGTARCKCLSGTSSVATTERYTEVDDADIRAVVMSALTE